MIDYDYYINTGKYFVVNGDIYLYGDVLSSFCKMDKNGNPIYDLEMTRDGRKRFTLTVKGTDAYAFDNHRVNCQTMMQWRKRNGVD